MTTEEKPKFLEDDSNLLLLSSNGFKYLRDIEHDKDTSNLSVSVVTKEKSLDLQHFSELLVTKKSFEGKKDENDDERAKMQEIFGSLKINNDITFGLGPLEFESAIDETEILKYRTMRIRCHASYVYGCAHAAYFIAIANKLK
jgi:hypothetical protein